MKRIDLKLCNTILRTLPPKYAALFAIGIGTGCRISEILPLRRIDLIDPETGCFREQVRFIKLKAEKENFRDLSIPETLAVYVRRWLNAEMERGYTRPEDWVFRGQLGKHMSRFTVYDRLKRIFAAVGLHGKYATHSMRKTFAYEIFHYFLHRNRADPMRALELTRQALGHARIDTTVQYLGICPEQIIRAQNEIFKNIGAPS